MASPQSITGAFSTEIPAISVPGFLINIGLAALLSWIVATAYVRYGSSMSNRASLARQFATIGMTTMIIITIVKSSLALSLGLVGALSIVRFRTAIKEPEELAYLFLIIAIGLGLGADQRLITILGAGVVVLIIGVRSRTRERSEESNLYLVVRQKSSDRVDLQKITSALEEHCTTLNLMRFDETDDAMEASYRVRFTDYGQLEAANRALRGTGEAVTVSFIDNEGMASC